MRLEPGHLVNGELFQWQLPRVLDDGTMVTNRLGTEASTLFVLQDGAIKLISVSRGYGVRYDDGTNLYGFSGEEQTLTQVDPKTGTPTSVDWFHTRAGTRFRLGVRGDLVTVELPDAAHAPTLALRLAFAGDPSIPAYGVVEVASGEDGTSFVYVIGGTDTGDGGQLAGFLTISPESEVSPAETTRNPFPPSDPGSPGHLGVQPGTSEPWIMFIDTDGVRVFARAIRS